MKKKLLRTGGAPPHLVIALLLLSAAVLKTISLFGPTSVLSPITSTGEWKILTASILPVEVMVGIALLVPRFRMGAMIGAFLLGTLYLSVHVWHFATQTSWSCSCYGKLSEAWPVLSILSTIAILTCSASSAWQYLTDSRSPLSRFSTSKWLKSLGLTSILALIFSSTTFAGQSMPCIQQSPCTTATFCVLQSSNGSDSCTGVTWTEGQYVTKSTRNKTKCQVSDNECRDNQPGWCYHIQVFNTTPCLSPISSPVFCNTNNFCGPLPP